jgi:glycosyltransferase involved in cell wall biosynthesis
MLRLTIWMNMPSIHQGDFFRALDSSPEVDLQVIFAKPLNEDRLRIGWSEDLAGFTSHFLNSHGPIRDAVRRARAERDRVHVVNGFWAEPAFAAALATLALAGSTYLIHGEAPDPYARRSTTKKMLRSSFGRFIGRRATGVLCISQLALDFYKGLKVAEKSIYPFGYFRSLPRSSDGSAPRSKTERSEIIFVGQLTERKGIDILIEAMRPLFKEHPGLSLKLVGAGDMQMSLRASVESIGLGDRVAFTGTIPSDEIPARIAQADLLVLPSRWDGWGLVVNEALASGVPVIVSDRCGAADLVRHGINGYVFPSEDVNTLRACLAKFLSGQTDHSFLRANALEMGDRISTEAAAPYFIQCLKHIRGLVSEKPIAPWTELSVASDVIA